MTWLVVISLVIVFSFAGVVLFGAPYLPTLGPQVKAALELADLQPGQTLLELGCGDGKVLVAAARLGVNSVGYELNPLLALFARLRTWRYRKLVKVVWGDFWRAKWPSADAIFVFLLPKYMPKLDKKIVQYYDNPVKLVSFAFEVPGRKVDQRRGGVFAYNYPGSLANRG